MYASCHRSTRDAVLCSWDLTSSWGLWKISCRRSHLCTVKGARKKHSSKPPWQPLCQPEPWLSRDSSSPAYVVEAAREKQRKLVQRHAWVDTLCWAQSQTLCAMRCSSAAMRVSSE